MKRNNSLRIEIEKKAAKFRQENSFDGNSPIHLKSLLLKKNVITIFKPLSGSLAGMAVKSKDLRFMMVNQNHNLGKQHFTIAHELYHLFIQEEFTSKKCHTGLFNSQTDPEEKRADLFAACLLLPEVGLRELIPDKELSPGKEISAETLYNIQHYYSVSMKCVIFRLVQLEYIPTDYFEKYSTGVKNYAKRLGYDISLYESGNFDKVIGDYGTLANSLYHKKSISESYYYQLMNAINVDPLANNVSENE